MIAEVFDIKDRSRFNKINKMKKPEIIKAYLDLEEFQEDQARMLQDEIDKLKGRERPPHPIISTVLGVSMPIIGVIFFGTGGKGVHINGYADIPSIILLIAGISGLVVSLSHVSEAIRVATGSSKCVSYFLAFLFEAGIVGLELSRLLNENQLKTYQVIFAELMLLIFIAAGNVITFNRHRRKMLRNLKEQS